MDRFQYNPDAASHAPHLIPFDDAYPVVHESVFLARGAWIIGDVTIGARSSVWFNAVVRGDVHYIRIGEGSNIQDNCVIHVTHDTNPAHIGNEVTVGHGAIIHGCTIEDTCLIGMGATVLDRAVVRSGAFVAAGAVVPPGFEVPSNTLVAGVPARVIRDLRPDEQQELHDAAGRYVSYARRQRDALTGSRPESSPGDHPTRLA
jgi:carbonic anhydrase/acetyltransferase-like protein (isoleucine patch superfamily)